MYVTFLCSTKFLPKPAVLVLMGHTIALVQPVSLATVLLIVHLVIAQLLDNVALPMISNVLQVQLILPAPDCVVLIVDHIHVTIMERITVPVIAVYLVLHQKTVFQDIYRVLLVVMLLVVRVLPHNVLLD